MSAPYPPLEKRKLPNLLEAFESSLIKRTSNIIEFAESSDFCGGRLYPRQRTLLKIIFLEELDEYDNKVLDEWIDSSRRGGEVKICPKPRERMKYLKENGHPHFGHVILTGGRRSSKGHITGCAIAKKIYDMTLIDNVGQYFGLDEDKDIYFSIVADSKDQAKAHQFSDVTNWIIDCKPLVDQQLISKLLAESTSVFTPYDKARVLKIESQQGRVEKDMAKLRIQVHGTNSRTIRGQAAMTIVFDEFAHLMPGESHLSDTELFKAATPSLKQFGKDALIFSNSSPYTKVGKFFELYQMSNELTPLDIGDPTYPDMFMLQFPSWELYKDWDRDEEIRQQQGLASYKWDKAIIVDPKYDAQFAREEQSNPESFKVEYRAQFAEVIDAFLNPEMVDRMFDPTFTRTKLGRNLKSEWGAVYGRVYKGHGDPSSTGANFGIAIGHVEQIVEEILDVNGMPSGQTLLAPHVVFDVVEAFYPEDFAEHTIDWMEVLPTIEDMINRFRPVEFTFDQYDSNYPIQKLNANLANRGVYETMVYEKTATHAKNFQRAMNFKAALNLGRVHAPHPTVPYDQGSSKRSLELVTQELKFLQEKNRRVDKQEIGPIQTKDIADCIMEVVDYLIGDSISNIAMADAQMSVGAHGGYNIGGKVSGTDPFSEYYEMTRQPSKMPLSRGGRFFNRRGPRGRM